MAGNGKLFLLLLGIVLCFAGCSADGEDTSPLVIDDLPNRQLTEKEALLEAFFEGLEHTKPLKEYGHKNPVMTQDFGADPNVLVWDDRLYLFMTADRILYDTDGKIKNYDYGQIKSLQVLSTADMVNWTQHSELFLKDVPGQSFSNIWAPALASRWVDGEFKVFLYFSNSGTSIAVFSAYHPEGPWTSPLGSKTMLSAATPGCAGVPWVFDPAVLVDGDRAFIYFGGGTPAGPDASTFQSHHPWPGTKRLAELNDDMTSIKEPALAVPLPFTFEASEINKFGGKYYYSYSSNPQVGHYATRPDDFPYAAMIGGSFNVVYAISDDPMGFTSMDTCDFKGTVLGNPGYAFKYALNNNHSKIFEFKGKLYIAYHTKLLMLAAWDAIGRDDEGNNYRSTSINAINVKENGDLEEVTIDKQGVEQVGSFNPYQSVPAATMGVMAGIKTREHQGQVVVTEIDSGDWIALYGVDFGRKGTKKFRCKVSGAGTGAIQLKTGGQDGRVTGYVDIQEEKGWITIDLLRTVRGKNDLVFVFYGDGYEFEEWQFLE